MAERTIAVLPFVSIGGTETGAYLSDGLTEELIYVFSRMEGIRVASRTSSFYFKDRPTDVLTVGRQLKVDFVLEGSVRLHRERVRVGVQLTSTQNGLSLWSDTYDREVVDILALQSEIAGEVFRRYLSRSGHVPPYQHTPGPQ